MSKVEFSIGELVNLRGDKDNQGALVKLVNTKLPVKAAYRLSRVVNKIDSELKEFDIARNDLIKEHGTEKDGMISIEPGSDAAKKFSEEIVKLLEEKIELEFNPVTIDMLGDTQLTASDMVALDKFIVVEEVTE